MAVVFSKITAIRESDKETKTFLARGIPKSFDDLEMYSAMDEILDDIDEDTTITIQTESYIYGDAKRYEASFEELAYMEIRMSRDELFLENHCRKVEEDVFCIEYAPDELFQRALGVIEC